MTSATMVMIVTDKDQEYNMTLISARLTSPDTRQVTAVDIIESTAWFKSISIHIQLKFRAFRIIPHLLRAGKGFQIELTLDERAMKQWTMS